MLIVGEHLSEIVNLDDIVEGKLNLIFSPCGSGKTTFAKEKLTVLSGDLYLNDKILMLIDTATGKDQLLHGGKKKKNRQTGEAYWDLPNMKVMTYAGYATLVDKAPEHDHWKEWAVIVCDEFHNAIKWSEWNDGKIHKRAIEIIAERIASPNTTVVALSATPNVIREKFAYCLNEVPLSGKPLQYEEQEVIEYRSLRMLLMNIPLGERGIIFVEHIEKILQYQEYMEERGFKTAAIWSPNNTDYPMSAKQHNVREYILTYKEMPPYIDILFINKSCETSITIGSEEKTSGHIDFMIIHSFDEDTTTQVRGRYRIDLEKLYVFNPYAIDEITMPNSYLDQNLRREDIDGLIRFLDIRDYKRRLVKAPTFLKDVKASGYNVISKTIRGTRYKVIQSKVQNAGQSLSRDAS